MWTAVQAWRLAIDAGSDGALEVFHDAPPIRQPIGDVLNAKRRPVAASHPTFLGAVLLLSACPDLAAEQSRKVQVVVLCKIQINPRNNSRESRPLRLA